MESQTAANTIRHTHTPPQSDGNITCTGAYMHTQNMPDLYLSHTVFLKTPPEALALSSTPMTPS